MCKEAIWGEVVNKEEARKVLGIMSTADTGCNVCASELMMKFVKSFPEHLKLAEEVYSRDFGYEGYKAEKLGLKNEEYQKLIEEIRKIKGKEEK